PTAVERRPAHSGLLWLDRVSDATPAGQRITQAYRAQLALIRQNVTGQAIARFGQVEGVPDDAAAADLVGQVVPVVEMGQGIVVQTTGAYLRLFSEVETGEAAPGDVVADPERFIGAAARGGVSLSYVY